MALFDPLTLRGVTLRNRVAVSPMCQYSAVDGLVNDWHLVHLGARAAGGAGLVIVEATAVEPPGRITPGCTGLWSDQHVPGLKRIVDFMRSQGAASGIQIGHAGRKASCAVPWRGGLQLGLGEGGWETDAPSAVAFLENERAPHALTLEEIEGLRESFAAAARRAEAAGFDVLEIHGAHGYLIGEFLSPLSNMRSDAYGGAFENRVRLALEVTDAVRAAWPERKPLFFRISATDWVEGGWTIDDTVRLAAELKRRGVDVMDCSSGGLMPQARIPAGPMFQVKFAEQVKRDSGLATAAVGMITEPEQADSIVASGKADLVLLARQMIRDPYWPIRAAKKLGAECRVPEQYLRAF
jgi:2,4-dienoyl-CoA reductase-like NADH-dependent reductase (Old Yellow Enzyme family)